MRTLALAVLLLLLLALLEPVVAKRRYVAVDDDEEDTPNQQQQFQQNQNSQQQQQQQPPQQQRGPNDKGSIEEMLKESEVLIMFEREQAKHDKRLKDLHVRLERELAGVQEHFESVMLKLKQTEEQIEQNLKNLENSINNKIGEASKQAAAKSSSWRWPFFALVVMLVGVALFFGNLYRKATKHTRML